jgi:cellobiose phosphorylase
MSEVQSSGWYFTDDQGTFALKNPQQTSTLYFPLLNQAGMQSCLTPTLNGDAKLDQNAFLLLPVSVEDLHNTRSARNFWVRINGEPWSATGNSSAQLVQELSDDDVDVTLQAGFLWHAVCRRHQATSLEATVLSFVPATEDSVELMQITLTNHGEEDLDIDPIAAIPIFGRSADNLRDHRHVTALLHRTKCHQYGVMVKPSMSFDERGHAHNQITYAVLGFDDEGNPPRGFTPLIEDFIGEGGCLTWPKAVIKQNPDLHHAHSSFDGFESIGGLHFQSVQLQPGHSKTYILILSIMAPEVDPDTLVHRYGSQEKFTHHLAETRRFWREKLASLRFDHQQERRDGWLQWVNLQPILRQLMGNSFLPYHDYGRGGRGWRDLWQDLLAILLTAEEGVDQLLLSNFAGVRMDGTNATIIGTSPGEFKADRNNIPRVWMDHGAWPLITTKLYLDRTGDLALLLQKQTYFGDHLSHRCQRSDAHWDPQGGTLLKSTAGAVIEGTILEHLLVQHLAVFFNVGEHNLIRLEGGDWNDGLDMATERGESVAFSALYAGNLRLLGEVCLQLSQAGYEETPIAVELQILLDTLQDPLDYDDIAAKQDRLQEYFDRVQGELSGAKVLISLEKLQSDLTLKADWLSNHIRRQEWLRDSQGYGWFNGYYDNEGQRVEGDHPQGTRMTLTGQVFPLMAGIATSEQAQQIVGAVDHYLYDPKYTGYRLNTDFGADVPALGRAFAFAYGHKENGAIFSHMAVMYAYALYQAGLADQAWQVLDGLYQQSQDFPISRIYPGIPEYFNPRGRGMYPYLTGSAAWYMFTLVTESFGVKGHWGDLCLAPKLVAGQFVAADALRVTTIFAGKQLDVIYCNPEHLTYGQYRIAEYAINGKAYQVPAGTQALRFQRAQVLDWPEKVHIKVNLSS